MRNVLSQIPKVGKHPQARLIESLLQTWATQPIFIACNDLITAQKLVTLSLWHTYLFGRFTLSSYTGHVFLALRNVPPADNILGPSLAGILEVARGELCTNNIFGRTADCRAHYYDMREAYTEVLGSDTHVCSFEKNERELGLAFAAGSSPLWTNEMYRYAQTLKRVTQDPLTSFLIALVSEDTIQRGYQLILKNLRNEKRFGKYRAFLKRHITLDQDEHGPSTVEWLRHYLKSNPVTARERNRALKNTVSFVKARIASYKI